MAGTAPGERTETPCRPAPDPRADLVLARPALGQDGTPMRVMARWLDLQGGRFVTTPFGTGGYDTDLILAAE